MSLWECLSTAWAFGGWRLILWLIRFSKDSFRLWGIITGFGCTIFISWHVEHSCLFLISMGLLWILLALDKTSGTWNKIGKFISFLDEIRKVPEFWGYLLGRLSTNGLFMRLASLSQGILPNFGTETWKEMERDHSVELIAFEHCHQNNNQSELMAAI